MQLQQLLHLHGKLYATSRAQALLQQLIQEITWQQDFVAFGRRFDVPRMQSWSADPGVPFIAILITSWKVMTWNKLLLSIKTGCSKTRSGS